MARILIVDDAAIIRRSLQHIIEKAGHEAVGMTGDGAEAIKLYKELKPDVVTMDVWLGEADGIQILESIKKEDPGAKVIMITSSGWEEKKEKSRQLGAAGYIGKPFDAKNIRDEIERVMGRKESE
ncbi:MAG: response regulator [Candidatus Brocadiales bacterium]|jgi:two-component system chemotaxis response regulator CheY|uniref:response regulator n=1 Tax=Candidatus Wunengus sp. YC60 TaxID=3367697 RepID=UPI0027134C1E|nr:response regulator [Candidatus Brocadiales bacterium]